MILRILSPRTCNDQLASHYLIIQVTSITYNNRVPAYHLTFNIRFHAQEESEYKYEFVGELDLGQVGEMTRTVEVGCLVDLVWW